MKKIEAIIFDMDGVLIDTERISFKSYQEVLKNYEYKMEEKFYLTMIGRNSKSIKRILKDKYGKDFPCEEIYKKKVKLAREIIDRDGVIIKKGVHELIDYLNYEKYKIAVATSTSRERALKMLKEIKIIDKVDYIICGDQVQHSKPDPEIFLKAAKGLDVSPENCIVIEDSDAGVMAANSAKMTAMNVPDMKTLDNEANKLVFKTCESLLDVKKYFESL